MEKKILIILGSGASKSLMTKDKNPILGIGRYKELPTGDELVSEIMKYEYKSIAWFIAYSCHHFIDANICRINKDKNNVTKSINPDTKFLDFARYVERIYPKKHHHILMEDEVRSLQENLQKEYAKYFEYDLNAKQNSSCIAMSFSIGVDGINSSIGNENIIKISKVFQASAFIKKIFDGVSTNYQINNDVITDAVFLKLLTIIVGNYTIYNKLAKFFKMIDLLDLLLSRLYGFIRDMLSSIHRVATKNVKHSRLSGNEIAPDSLYKVKNDAFDEVIQEIREKLISSLHINDEILSDCKKVSLDNVKSNIKEMRESLHNIYNEIAEYSRQPVENRSRMIGSFIGYNTNYIDGLFGMRTLEGNLTIDNSVIDKLNLCKMEFDDFTKIENLAENDLNNIVRTLYEYGFNLGYHSRGRSIINKLQISNTLLLNVAKYIACNVFNITNDHSNFIETAIHLKGCFLSASLVSCYKPYSIDYFMMNLEHLAPYEFFDIKDSRNLIDERIKSIQKYTKFIIADCLMPAATYAHYAREHDNYIQRMKWRILENALFYKKTLSEYLCENVKIITFNYEMSFETLLYEMLSKDDADKLHSNITGVYGKIYLEVLEGEKKNCINMCKEDAIWESVFFTHNSTYAIKTNGKHSENTWIKYVLCKNILEQFEERIQWIGEQKDSDKIIKDRLMLQEQIVNADEMYFLGFGFDVNNLYQLGVIDNLNKLEVILQNKEKPTKILISGGNAKIINLLKSVFKIDNCSLVNDVYHLQNKNYDMYISSKMLPDALIYDL